MQPVSQTLNNPNLLIAENTKVILFSDNYKAINEAVHALHHVFSTITGIRAGDITDEDMMLPQGKAVSPIKAAHCLLETQRTRCFLRGIYKAIIHFKQKSPDHKIHILYAGCGPYATLLTPLTTMFEPLEIAISLLDVNETSVNATRRLFEALGLTDYVNEYIIADATTYQVNPGKRVDIIVSETMLNGLRSEPMVAIMNNLIPQLNDAGVFIPQQITVDAALLGNEEEIKAMTIENYIPRRIALGNVYRIGTSSKKDQHVTLPLPPDFGKIRLLNLLTEINVFEDEKLTINQCSLTTPWKIAIVEHEMNYKAVTFKYEQGTNPHFKHQFIQ